MKNQNYILEIHLGGEKYWVSDPKKSKRNVFTNTKSEAQIYHNKLAVKRAIWRVKWLYKMPYFCILPRQTTP